MKRQRPPFRMKRPTNRGPDANAAEAGPRAHAVRESLRERRRQSLWAAYAEASRDPMFVAEMADTDRQFDATIGDGLSASG